MEQNSQNIPGMVKQIQLLHLIIILSILPLIFLLIFLSSDINQDLPSFSDPFFWIVNAAVFLSVPAGNILFFKTNIDAAKKTELEERLTIYRKALVIRNALFDFASILCIILFFLDPHFYYMFLSLLILGLLVFRFPTIGKIAHELKLTKEEKEMLKSKS